MIGGLSTLNAVGENDLVRRHAAVLSEACLKAAAPQVRNRATIAGNVLQKTRCEYFRSEAPLPWRCNKRNPGSGCAAREGVNHRHAIFGWTDGCVATQPSDPAVALACLDAHAEVQSAKGRRRIPMTGFHLTQQEAEAERGDAAQHETQLAPDELIIAYHIPLRDGQRRPTSRCASGRASNTRWSPPPPQSSSTAERYEQRALRSDRWRKSRGG